MVREQGSKPAVLEFDTRAYGTILEAEPSVGADGFTISLNIALEHHTAEPQLDTIADGIVSPRFHAKTIQTNCVLLDGGYLILGTWKPTGKDEYAEGDVRHIVFVTANLQTLGE
jgi:type II secretory pathway component GspD/PulD (secretin)